MEICTCTSFDFGSRAILFPDVYCVIHGRVIVPDIDNSWKVCDVNGIVLSRFNAASCG